MSPAAYWASWADCVHTVHLRHPVLGDQIEAALSRGERGQHCEMQGTNCWTWEWKRPPWEDLARGAVPRNDLHDAEPGVKHGWQFQATQKVEDCHSSGCNVAASFRSISSIVAFPGWPHGQVAIPHFPSAVHFRFDAQPFRVLLLRLWLPLPCSARNCRCGRPLDSSGHHRAACAVAGVLGRRGFVVESAAARVCREAGARVSLNVRVQDMDLARPDVLDNRPLGAQREIDTAVSPRTLRFAPDVRGFPGGLLCCLAMLLARSPCPCWSVGVARDRTVRLRPRCKCWRMPETHVFRERRSGG